MTGDYRKFQIKIKRPISPSGMEQWGRRQKPYISKSPNAHLYVRGWSSKEKGSANVSDWSTNQRLGEWLIKNFPVENGSTYELYGYCHRKTKLKCGLTKVLARILVTDADKNAFTIFDTQNINRMGFRRNREES